MITVNNLVHHEFIGLSVSVTSVSNESLRLKGTVIDETKNTIKIEVDDNVEKIIQKKGSIFVFELPTGEKVEINGNILSIRPEDRIKKRFKKNINTVIIWLGLMFKNQKLHAMILTAHFMELYL